MELRPILDREFEHWQIVLDPVFERSEPALLLRWKRKTFSPSLKYYGEIESINLPPHAQPEVHQLSVGEDWKVRREFSVNLGIGVDVGGRGAGVVLKSRLEWDWGSHPKPLITAYLNPVSMLRSTV